MFGCFLLVLTLGGAVLFVFRLRKFQKWEEESKLCNQMHEEVEQMKSMVSDILLEAHREDRKKRGGDD